MSLADVARTAARAAVRRTVAFSSPGRGSRLARIGSFLGERDLEPIVRWSVPAALVIFITILVAISVSFTFAEQDRIIAAATADAELAASVVAADVGARLQSSPRISPSEALAASIPAHAFRAGQQVYLSDATGTVVASFPDPEAKGSIGDHLGAAQPLTVFAEKAGVMRLTLPDGAEVLATVRSLPEPLGQITLVHPMDEVLRDWRAGVTRTIVLLSAIAAVLVALALAYLVQATKAREADTSCKMMRDRVDMVLSRGRCGLFDFDLTSGLVDWSMSMFEILGLPPPRTHGSRDRRAPASFADGGFDEMARVLSSGAQATVDTAFRMRRRRRRRLGMAAREGRARP